MAEEQDHEIRDLRLEDVTEAPESQRQLVERKWVRIVGLVLAAMMLISVLLPIIGIQQSRGDKTPDQQAVTTAEALNFTLLASDGTRFELAEAAKANRYVVLVFYRGFF